MLGHEAGSGSKGCSPELLTTGAADTRDQDPDPLLALVGVGDGELLLLEQADLGPHAEVRVAQVQPVTQPVTARWGRCSDAYCIRRFNPRWFGVEPAGRMSAETVVLLLQQLDEPQVVLDLGVGFGVVHGVGVGVGGWVSGGSRRSSSRQ